MAENMTTVLGKEATITGKLEVTTSLRVDGNVKGEVVAQETLVIGNTGKVEGDVTAKNCVVAGQVLGNVMAQEKVELQAKSLLQGDLKTKSLVIEQGAVFQGACRMKEGEVAPRKAPVEAKA